MRIFTAATVISSAFLSQFAFGESMQCREGYASITTTDFSNANKTDPSHACPVRKGGCVVDNACPQLALPFCAEGSKYEVVVTDYYIADSERGLSCPVQVGACVRQDYCPQLAPIRCDDGTVETVVTGFYSIGNGLSCPKIKMACVNKSMCLEK